MDMNMTMNTKSKTPLPVMSAPEDRLAKNATLGPILSNFHKLRVPVDALDVNPKGYKPTNDTGTAEAAAYKMTLETVREEDSKLERARREMHSTLQEEKDRMERRRAERRAAKTDPPQLDVDVAGTDARKLQKEIEGLKVELRAAKDMEAQQAAQIAALKKKAGDRKVEVRRLKKKVKGYKTAKRVVRAAEKLRDASAAMGGANMGEFGEALDGLRDSLRQGG
jgi:hypothetical protein